jgi:hypothetical protein
VYDHACNSDEVGWLALQVVQPPDGERHGSFAVYFIYDPACSRFVNSQPYSFGASYPSAKITTFFKEPGKWALKEVTVAAEPERIREQLPAFLRSFRWLSSRQGAMRIPLPAPGKQTALALSCTVQSRQVCMGAFDSPRSVHLNVHMVRC